MANKSVKKQNYAKPVVAVVDIKVSDKDKAMDDLVDGIITGHVSADDLAKDVKREAKKLQPKWKNEPTFQDLDNDRKEAANSHEILRANIIKWQENMAGGPELQTRAGRSKARPRLIRRQAEWKYPALEEPFLSTQDMFKVQPRTYEDEEAAIQNELVLNYQFSTKVNKVKLVNDIVRNMVDEGTAIVKTGWEAEEEVVIEEEEQPDYASPEESLIMMQQAVASGQMSQEEMARMMDEGEPMVKGTKMVKVERTRLVVNQPKYEVCNIANVIIDPTCEGDISRANFVIHEYNTSYAELKKDEYRVIEEDEDYTDENGQPATRKVKTEIGFYHNLDVMTLEDSESTYDQYASTSSNQFKYKDKARKKLRAHEYWGYWDIHGNGELTAIVATWVNKTMIRLEENPYPHKRVPFSIAPYMPVKREVYGEPDGELLIENQESIGKMIRAAHDITAEQAVGQTFIDSSLFPSPVEKANYEAGKTVYFRPGLDPRTAIHKKSVEPIPASVFSMIQMQNGEAEALTGTKSFSGGISGQALGSSATGVRSAMDATSKRELSILRRLSSMFTDIARLTISMNQAFLDEKEVVRVTNDKFVEVRRDDLAGEFDLKVDVSTPEKDNETAEKLTMLMQTNAANMDAGLVAIHYAKIARLWKMPDLAEAVENYKPQPNPLKEELERIQLENAKLENERLRKTIENLDSQIHERISRTLENQDADMVMKASKSELLRAQAAKILAEADLLEQKYVRTAEGADRAEKLEDKQFDALNKIEEMRARNQGILAAKEHSRLADIDKMAIEDMREQAGYNSGIGVGSRAGSPSQSQTPMSGSASAKRNGRFGLTKSTATY